MPLRREPLRCAPRHRSSSPPNLRFFQPATCVWGSKNRLCTGEEFNPSTLPTSPSPPQHHFRLQRPRCTLKPARTRLPSSPVFHLETSLLISGQQRPCPHPLTCPPFHGCPPPPQRRLNASLFFHCRGRRIAPLRPCADRSDAAPSCIGLPGHLVAALAIPISY